MPYQDRTERQRARNARALLLAFAGLLLFVLGFSFGALHLHWIAAGCMIAAGAASVGAIALVSV